MSELALQPDAVIEDAAPARPKRPPVVLETVESSDLLKVWRHRGTSDRLVLSFSGVGTPKHGVKPDFVKTATGHGRNHVLYIADPNRTWMNGPGLIDRIVRLVEDEVKATGARQVVSLGHSMGGFCALAIPALTRVDAALAYSPQVSIDPRIVPGDRRWGMYRDKIDAIVLPSALEPRAAGCEYFVIFGDIGREAAQRNLVVPAAGLHLFILPKVDHHSAAKVLSIGLGEELLEAAFLRRVWRMRRQLRRQLGGYQVPIKEG